MTIPYVFIEYIHIIFDISSYITLTICSPTYFWQGHGTYKEYDHSVRIYQVHTYIIWYIVVHHSKHMSPYIFPTGTWCIYRIWPFRTCLSIHTYNIWYIVVHHFSMRFTTYSRQGHGAYIEYDHSTHIYLIHTHIIRYSAVCHFKHVSHYVFLTGTWCIYRIWPFHSYLSTTCTYYSTYRLTSLWAYVLLHISDRDMEHI